MLCPVAEKSWAPSSFSTAFLTDAIYRRPACETAEAQNRAGGSAWTLLFAATPMGTEMGAQAWTSSTFSTTSQPLRLTTTA